MPAAIAIRIHPALVDGELEADELRERTLKRCEALGSEFPEVTHLEIMLSSPASASYEATGRVTGKATELASHATADQAERAVEKLLHTLRHQLRRTHDKHIFQHRRESRR